MANGDPGPAREAAAIAVEVMWSPAPRELRRVALALPTGATLADALRQAGCEAGGQATAVWGRLRSPETPLRDGDRVELLRPLVVDPMTARRARYAAAGGAQALRRRRYEAQQGLLKGSRGRSSGR